jgi:hypothetical protein
MWGKEPAFMALSWAMNIYLQGLSIGIRPHALLLPPWRHEQEFVALAGACPHFDHGKGAPTGPARGKRTRL